MVHGKAASASAQIPAGGGWPPVAMLPVSPCSSQSASLGWSRSHVSSSRHPCRANTYPALCCISCPASAHRLSWQRFLQLQQSCCLSPGDQGLLPLLLHTFSLSSPEPGHLCGAELSLSSPGRLRERKALAELGSACPLGPLDGCKVT